MALNTWYRVLGEDGHGGPVALSPAAAWESFGEGKPGVLVQGQNGFKLLTASLLDPWGWRRLGVTASWWWLQRRRR